MFKAIKTIIEDYKAVFERDPAARGFWGRLEVFFTYSGFHAIAFHRLTHFLYKLRLPLIPRALSQLSRFLTGVEIHPAAQIGKGFFIDHGSGVVIGETTIIGDNVTLFQCVTLGGTGKEKGKRHPTLKNNVVVGAGAKVLGNIVIGNNVYIGANAVVLDNVGDNSTVVGVPGRVIRLEGKRVSPGITFDHKRLPDPIKDRLQALQEEIARIEKHLIEFEKKERKKVKEQVRDS